MPYLVHYSPIQPVMYDILVAFGDKKYCCTNDTGILGSTAANTVYTAKFITEEIYLKKIKTKEIFWKIGAN